MGVGGGEGAIEFGNILQVVSEQSSGCCNRLQVVSEQSSGCCNRLQVVSEQS